MHKKLPDFLAKGLLRISQPESCLFDYYYGIFGSFTSLFAILDRAVEIGKRVVYNSESHTNSNSGMYKTGTPRNEEAME